MTQLMKIDTDAVLQVRLDDLSSVVQCVHWVSICISMWATVCHASERRFTLFQGSYTMMTFCREVLPLIHQLRFASILLLVENNTLLEMVSVLVVH